MPSPACRPRGPTPGALLALLRGHWGIENRLHYVRDVTFDEDRSQSAPARRPRRRRLPQPGDRAAAPRRARPTSPPPRRTYAGRPRDRDRPRRHRRLPGDEMTLSTALPTIDQTRYWEPRRVQRAHWLPRSGTREMSVSVRHPSSRGRRRLPDLRRCTPRRRRSGPRRSRCTPPWPCSRRRTPPPCSGCNRRGPRPRSRSRSTRRPGSRHRRTRSPRRNRWARARRGRRARRACSRPGRGQARWWWWWWWSGGRGADPGGAEDLAGGAADLAGGTGAGRAAAAVGDRAGDRVGVDAADAAGLAAPRAARAHLVAALDLRDLGVRRPGAEQPRPDGGERAEEAAPGLGRGEGTGQGIKPAWGPPGVSVRYAVVAANAPLGWGHARAPSGPGQSVPRPARWPIGGRGAGRGFCLPFTPAAGKQGRGGSAANPAHVLVEPAVAARDAASRAGDAAHGDTRRAAHEVGGARRFAALPLLADLAQVADVAAAPAVVRVGLATGAADLGADVTETGRAIALALLVQGPARDRARGDRRGRRSGADHEGADAGEETAAGLGRGKRPGKRVK